MLWPDWHALFVPSGPLLEVIVRGTVTYLVLFTFMRFLRRQAGSIGIADLLVIVLIADASQNAMAGGYRSITEGIVLVATILGWDYLLDWMGYRWPLIQRFVRPPPLPLIKNGRVQRRNLRQEMITQDELLGLLRKHQVEDVAQVKNCCLEADGEISVIRFDGKGAEAPQKKRPT